MKKLLTLLASLGALVVFLYINNNWIMTTNHTYESAKVPSAFDGFRITHITDLHDAMFGENQTRLVEKVKATKPDVIFITGDLVDSRRYDLQSSLLAVEQFIEIADVYYVLGNHEVALNEMDTIYRELMGLGVNILPNTAVTLERDGQQLAIAGIEDPLMGNEADWMIEQATKEVEDTFTLLLSHRPEEFETYVASGVDVVFTGHAHGGQVRLPFIGGLVAPTQGLFPKYTAGVHAEKDTTMFISRGLGNSVFPYRIFNLPEIITMELKSM